MKTFISCKGGKRRISKILIAMFQKNYELQVEKFVGTGNIYFRLTEDKKPVPMTINGLNKRTYTVSKALQGDSKYINDNICRKFITRERFNEIKHNEDAISIIETYKSSF